MKTKILLFLPALIALLNLLPAGRGTAQIFTTLHSFNRGSDGAYPGAGWITNSSGNTLYGTAPFGGSTDNGTVFAVNTEGTSFTTLHSFTAAPYGTNSDGAVPGAVLILSGGTLYGTASSRGSSGYGTVFAVNADGTGFTNLHNFTYSDGAYPLAGLILSGNTLYGTASAGGSLGWGTVFAVNTDGTGFTNLHSFNLAYREDAAEPHAGLILLGNTLYGTADSGGGGNFGAVFAVNTDGTGFTNLYSFTGGSDGAYPLAGLILSGDTLYGTANRGGSWGNGGGSGNGTVFAVNTDGTGFTNLHSFTEGPYDPITDRVFNSDGAWPQAGLILSGNTLYGTAGDGGSGGYGTVFAVNTDGTGFTNLHNFPDGYQPSCGCSTNSDGANPYAGVVLSGNTLYGAAAFGSSSGNGTVFSLSLLLPPLPEQINGLIALVQSLGLQSGTANSLVVKLQGAGSALDRGSIEATCGNLGAFLNEANARKGKNLTAAQGDLLNAEATRIRAVLGCR